MPLRANEKLSCPGVKLHGCGVHRYARGGEPLSGWERPPASSSHIRPYLNGRDLNQRSRNVMVIDLFGLTIDEVEKSVPRGLSADPESREARARPKQSERHTGTNWWIFGKPRNDFRPALVGLERYIATTETSKHRYFIFLDTSILARQHAHQHRTGGRLFSRRFVKPDSRDLGPGSRGEVRGRQRSAVYQDAMFRHVPISDMHRRPERP